MPDTKALATASPSAGSPIARLIAFYLPQFHPIPENDRWWGAGFTEWTNVAKAKPLFPGHWQPRLPADLGFYDLRVPEVREQQAALARSSGVEGFCYWHYWFGDGKRILERPFAEVLASGRPDFPFCLAWANQSWTGIWHGNPNSKLMEQKYPGKTDEEAHFNLVLPAFQDSRYLKVDGKPIFIVYDPADMPSTSLFITHWQRLAVLAGLPGIYFVAITNRHSFKENMYENETLDPFDAVTPLVPQDYLDSVGRKYRATLSGKMKERTFGATINRILGEKFRRPARFSYQDVVKHALNELPHGRRFLPSVLPNWDNTPRSGVRGVVYENAEPELFRSYLKKAVLKISDKPKEEKIIFLKAWNEWAEGNYVEPDSVYGHKYLEVIKQQMYVD